MSPDTFDPCKGAKGDVAIRKITKAQKDQEGKGHSGAGFELVYLMVSSHAPSCLSRKVDWGGEVEIPTNAVCLMVSQNTHRTSNLILPPQALGLGKESIVFTLVISGLSCSVYAIYNP